MAQESNGGGTRLMLKCNMKTKKKMSFHILNCRMWVGRKSWRQNVVDANGWSKAASELGQETEMDSILIMPLSEIIKMKRDRERKKIAWEAIHVEQLREKKSKWQ